MSDHWNSLANLLGTPSITPASKKSEAPKAKSEQPTVESARAVEKSKEPSRLRSSWDAVTSFFGIQSQEADSPVQSSESDRHTDVASKRGSDKEVVEPQRTGSKRNKTSFWDTADSEKPNTRTSTFEDAPAPDNQNAQPAEPDVSFGAPRRKTADRPVADRGQRGNGQKEHRQERPRQEERNAKASEKTLERSSETEREIDADSPSREARPASNRHKDRTNVEDRVVGDSSPERRSHRRPPRRGRGLDDADGSSREISGLDAKEPSEDVVPEIRSADADSSSRGRDRYRRDRDDSRRGTPSRNQPDSPNNERSSVENRGHSRGAEDRSESRIDGRPSRSSNHRDSRSESRETQRGAVNPSGESREDTRRSPESAEATRGDSRRRREPADRNLDRPARNDRGRGPRLEKAVEERKPSRDVFGDGIDETVDYSPMDDEGIDGPARSVDDRVADESEKRRERRPRGERPRGEKAKRQLSEEDDRRGGDEDREAVSAVTKSGKIPSWAEALEGIVAANTENHLRNTGGGRGRGRGPR